MNTDWNPATYGRFADLRRRPGLDLLAGIGALPPGDVIDLGCGAGALADALAARFQRPIIGVDQSKDMLAKAAETRAYSSLIEADIASFSPETPPALIYSNAALHWLADHSALMPRLAGLLAPGGVLAVQMPRQYDAPSHALLRDIAADLFPDRFNFDTWQAPVARAEDYARLLAPLGRGTAWETTYVQRLAPTDHSTHPVRAFTEGAAMRPFLAPLSEEEAGRFTSAYEAQLAAAYPQEEDGAVLFPFTRTFFIMETSQDA